MRNSNLLRNIKTFINDLFVVSARIYTILIDSADVMLLTNFIVSTALSSAVFAAVLYYKKPEKPKTE